MLIFDLTSIMAARLSSTTFEWQNVIAALRDVTTPYQLGIQFNIDPSKLDEIERNHRGDINRQKTEVIKYWLRNSPDASWTTLANAVERMGGHDNLVETLRTYGLVRSDENEDGTSVVCLEGVPFTILLLGLHGHGKSTLGNRLLNAERYFRVNNNLSPQLCTGSAMLKSKSQAKNYSIDVYDHDGFLESHCSVESLLSHLPSKLNLVLFVVKRGHKFWSRHQKKLRTIITTWEIDQISALVLTHCEQLSEDRRRLCSDQFKVDNPSITELMGKGIITVGFPHSCHVQPGSLLSLSVKSDTKKLRELIYSCDEGVEIPQTAHNNSRGSDSDDTRPIIPPESNLEIAQEHSSKDKTCCCLIL